MKEIIFGTTNEAKILQVRGVLSQASISSTLSSRFGTWKYNNRYNILMAEFEKTKKSKEIVYAIKEALPEMLNFKQFRPFAGDGVFDTGKADVTEQLVRHIIRRIYQKNRTFSVMDLVNLL